MPYDSVSAGQNYADSAGRILLRKGQIESQRRTGKANAYLSVIPQITKALTPLNEDQALARRMTLDEAQAKRQAVIDQAADKAAIDAAFQTHNDPDAGPDFKGIISSLNASGRVAAALKVSDIYEKIKKDGLAQSKAASDLRDQDAKAMSRLFNGVDPVGYQASRKMAIANDPSAASALPEEFDQSVVDLLGRAGTEVPEQNRIANEKRERLASGKDWRDASAIMADSKSPEDWDEGLAQVGLFADRDVYRRIKAMGYSDASVKAMAESALSVEKRADLAGQQAGRDATAAQQGIVNQRATEAAGRDAERLELERRRVAATEKNAGKQGGGSSAGTYDAMPLGDKRLVDAIIKNPGLYDKLTPTVIGRLAGALEEKGFDSFGKPLDQGAITKITDGKSAIKQLEDLRGILQKNEQYIGPLAGLQALNPYSDARKAQADIDRVRQRVGKALEGGVLRKEDEEKYKKILSTLRDEPSTAIYKIDQLIQNFGNDIAIFEQEQKRSGRRMPGAGSVSLGTTKIVEQGGNTFEVTYDAAGNVTGSKPIKK